MISLNYRKNVAGIIINSGNKILLLRKTGRDFWQFVQGGMKEQESEKEAISREIKEETGIENFEIIKKFEYGFEYEWSKELQKKKGFRGQRQIFFLVKIKNIPKIKLNEEEKLEEFRWENTKNVEKFIAKNFVETWKKIKDKIIL